MHNPVEASPYTDNSSAAVTQLPAHQRVGGIARADARSAQRGRTWTYDEACRAFAATALSALPLVILAAVLLAHGTIADAAWAHAAGVSLLLVLGVTQIVIRRRVMGALVQHHREAGLDDPRAHACAKATLDAWLK